MPGPIANQVNGRRPHMYNPVQLWRNTGMQETDHQSWRHLRNKQTCTAPASKKSVDFAYTQYAGQVGIQHTKYSMAISSHSLLGTFRRVTLVRLKHLCPAFFWLQGCGKSQLAFVIPCLMDSILGYCLCGLLSFFWLWCVYMSFRLRLSWSEISMWAIRVHFPLSCLSFLFTSWGFEE